LQRADTCRATPRACVRNRITSGNVAHVTASVATHSTSRGLRAIAAGAVVLYYAHFPGLRGGYVGVDVFFEALQASSAFDPHCSKAANPIR